MLIALFPQVILHHGLVTEVLSYSDILMLQHHVHSDTAINNDAKIWVKNTGINNFYETEEKKYYQQLHVTETHKTSHIVILY